MNCSGNCTIDNEPLIKVTKAFRELLLSFLLTNIILGGYSTGGAELATPKEMQRFSVHNQSRGMSDLNTQEFREVLSYPKILNFEM
jgi:hypothetical protein